MIGRKIVALGTIAALTLTLAACGGSSASGAGNSTGSAETVSDESKEATPEKKEEPTPANIGDEISVSTEYGDLKVTVEGLDRSKSLYDTINYDGSVPAGQSIYALRLIVKNVSYNDSYNKGFVDLNNALRLEDADGITVNPMSSAYEYGEYSLFAGAFGELAEGQTVRAVIEYQSSADLSNATVLVGDSAVSVSAVDVQ